MEEVIQERGNRLLIIVDELDRCKPSFAVALLERMKHYFSNEHVTFLFALNESALCHTINKTYGEQYDSTRYLDRFFDLTTTLPPVNIDAFSRYISLSTNSIALDAICAKLVTGYRFSMREIIRFYNAINAGIGAINRQSTSQLYCTYFLFPVAVALRMTNSESYQKYIKGENFTAFNDFMQNVLNEDVTCKFDSKLLNDNEAFSGSAYLSKQIVSIEDKYLSVYNALFLPTYNFNDYQPIRIGEIEISEALRRDFFLQLGAFNV